MKRPQFWFDLCLGFLISAGFAFVVFSMGTAEAKRRCDKWVSPAQRLVHIIAHSPSGITVCLTRGRFRIGSRRVEPKSRMTIVGAPVRVRKPGRILAPTKIRGRSPLGIVDLQGTTGVVLKNLDICCATSGGHSDNPYGRNIQPGDGAYRLSYVRSHGAASQGTGGCPPHTVLNHVELDHNGSGPFLTHSAGVKCVRAFRVSNSYIHDNGPTSNGAWCDGGCSGGTFVVENSVFHDNGRKGIHYEISGGSAIIRNNVVYHNNHKDHQDTGGGIKVTSSRGVRVYGNRTWDNWGGGIRAHKDKRGFALSDIFIHDNTVKGRIKGCGSRGVTCRDNWRKS